MITALIDDKGPWLEKERKKVITYSCINLFKAESFIMPDHFWDANSCKQPVWYISYWTIIFIKHKLNNLKNCLWGTSLAVQWLRICTSTAGGHVSIPAQVTKILYVLQYDQKKKKICLCYLRCFMRTEEASRSKTLP